MQKAVVFGATGFCGRFVVEALRRAGIATVAHVRPDSPSHASWSRQFGSLGAQVDTTTWTEDALRARLLELAPTHVFALLGTTAKRARRDGLRDPYQRVDYALTAMVIEAAAALPVPPRFVYLSSAGVGSAQNDYLRARQRAEAKLRAAALPYLIARPGLFTGKRDEVRPAEVALNVLLPPVAAVLQRLGARKVAAQVRPMTGQALGEALVHYALGAQERRVLEAIDLQGTRGGT